MTHTLRRIAVLAIVLSDLACPALAGEAADSPLVVPRGQAQLFIDDRLIASQSGLKRTLHQPVKDGGGNEPILAFKPPAGSGATGTLEANGSIVFDERLRRYVMFALAFSPTTNGDGRVRVMRFTSADALRWVKGDGDGTGERATFDTLDRASGRRAGGHDLFSCHYDRTDAAYPYKGWLYYWNWGDLDGICFVRSADGKTWERGPMVARAGSREIHQDGRTLRGPQDVTLFSYSPATGQLLASIKFGSVQPVGPGNALRSRAYAFVRRLDEPLDLAAIQRIALLPPAPDVNGDRPNDEYYASTAWRYESIWLGGLKVWHRGGNYPWSAAGCAFLKLVVSDDGLTWHKVQFPGESGQRDEVFLANGPEGGNHGHNDGGYVTEFSQGPLRVGDELLYYYGCSSWGKNQSAGIRVTGGGIFRARLRVDGFVSVDAGTLTTPPLRFAGGDLLLNAVGPVTVELLDSEGRALASANVQGDSIRHRVTFGRTSLAKVAASGAVRLRFTADTGGQLYSFKVE